MKKIFAVLAVCFAFITSVYSLENVFDMDYSMPFLNYSDENYYYTKAGYGFMLDYRCMLTNTIGLQIDTGLNIPTVLNKTKISTNDNKAYYADDEDSWFVLNNFFGCAFRLINTDLVELVITPGGGCDFECYTNGSNSNDSYCNLNFGLGVDLVTNVKIADSIGITAGILVEYQPINFSYDFGSDESSKNRSNFLLIMPRAGISLTL